MKRTSVKAVAVLIALGTAGDRSALDRFIAGPGRAFHQ